MQKKKRIVNDVLRKLVAKDPCAACGSHGSVCAHIKSKGAGGDDIWENLLPLCVDCHTHGKYAQHKWGWERLYKRFRPLQEALRVRGWTLENDRMVRIKSYDEENK
jgi:hypothetical protein